MDREAWQATSPWGRKVSDMTERLSLDIKPLYIQLQFLLQCKETVKKDCCRLVKLGSDEIEYECKSEHAMPLK